MHVPVTVVPWLSEGKEGEDEERKDVNPSQGFCKGEDC